MIRFVRIGNQIVGDSNQFAFFDTVTDTFMDFDGEQVFDDRFDFIENVDWHNNPDLLTRCLALLDDGEHR